MNRPNTHTIQATYVKNLTQKIKGLIGAQKPVALYFKTRWGIHTFGLKFAIDIVILDTNNTVVHMFHNVPQQRIIFWNPLFNTVLELPEGTIYNNRIQKGDTIILKAIDDEPSDK
ncbi:DUF192 domain-containing protein [candidate division WWE3 bacterium]|nr:DUF192 domain-containing protein [candidate division WWE3 bacterium]